MTVGEWLTPDGFHVSPESEFEWTSPPLPLIPSGYGLLFVIPFLGLICSLILGYQKKWVLLLVFGGVFYMTFADTDAAFTLNNLFVAIYAILLLAPREVSFRESDGASLILQSRWVVRTIQAGMILILFTAGTSKAIFGDWVLIGGIYRDGAWHFSGWFQGVSDVLLTQSSGIYRTEFCAWMIRTLPLWCWAALQHSALAFELLAPILFTVPKLRRFGILWALGFQLMIGLTMYKVGFFNFQMCTFLILFVNPGFAEKIEEKISRLNHRYVSNGAPE